MIATATEIIITASMIVVINYFHYSLVRAAGLEPARRIESADFPTTIAFATVIVCGLDYPFIISLLT